MSIKSSNLKLVVTSLTLFSLLFLLYSLTFKNLKSASALATHVVISEVQILGTTANDEFVELYNPTDNVVDLTGWRLNKRNSAGTAQNLVASMSGQIPAHGYYLVASPSYDGSTTPDTTYSASSSAITTNNTIYLFSDAGVTLVDKVGFGTSYESETSPFPDNSIVDGSIERKPGETSPTSGNGEDSDNNTNDFALRTISDPQNSLSATEIPSIPTNSPTPTALLPTVTDKPSLTPTELPTATPAISPTPTETLTLTPTLEPTVTTTPFISISPTITQGPSLAPTKVLTVTPTKAKDNDRDRDHDDFRHKFTHRFHDFRKEVENRCREIVKRFGDRFHRH